MPDGASALQLVLGGDPALYAIVALSLYVSLSAVAARRAWSALPFGALLALTQFPGRTFIVVVINAFMGLPPVVVGLAVYLLLSRSGPLGSLGILFTPKAMVVAQALLVMPIIAALTRQTIEDLWAEYREELTALRVAPGAPRRDADLGRALLAGHDAARGLRPRRGGGRRRDDRRRQHRRLHPHDDDRDRAGDLQGRPAARAGARPGADHADHRRQCARLGRAARRRNRAGCA